MGKTPLFFKLRKDEKRGCLFVRAGISHSRKASGGRSPFLLRGIWSGTYTRKLPIRTGKNLSCRLRHRSVRTFAGRPLSRKDLSDLLWAANGINRPESGKRTAPSAMNRQDVGVYVCLPEGNYRYDAKALMRSCG